MAAAPRPSSRRRCSSREIYVMKAGIDRLREAREREGRLTPDLIAQLEQSQRALDVRVDAVRQMTEAGVRMTAGSDSPWGWYAPGEFVHEIHILARAGLSYGDAIMAGTAGGRRPPRPRAAARPPPPPPTAGGPRGRRGPPPPAPPA